jgi:hypothetical protein
MVKDRPVRKNPGQVPSEARSESAPSRLKDAVLNAVHRKQLKNRAVALEQAVMVPSNRRARRRSLAPRQVRRGATGRSSFQRYQMVLDLGKRSQCTAKVRPHKGMERRCSRLSVIGDNRCAQHGGVERRPRVRTHGRLVPLHPENEPVLVGDW